MKMSPCIKCTDARATIEWLQTALGFDPRGAHDNPDGTVAHAELGWGDDRLMLGQASGASAPTPVTLYLSCPDPDARFERAVAAGATVVYEPRDTDYGSREAAVADADGHTYSFGTYEPG